MTKLFHTEVFVPAAAMVEAQQMVFSALRYTKHAVRALVEDRYGRINPPASVTVAKWNIFELEVTDGRVTKLGLRHAADERRDVVLVLRPLARDEALVVTTWVNLKTDSHRTLDRSKYNTN